MKLLSLGWSVLTVPIVNTKLPHERTCGTRIKEKEHVAAACKNSQGALSIPARPERAPTTPSRSIVENQEPHTGEVGLLITDRKIAERKLREWIERLEDSQSAAGCVLTLGELLSRYKAVKSGSSDSTKENANWMAKKLGSAD